MTRDQKPELSLAEVIFMNGLFEQEDENGRVSGRNTFR